MSGEYGGYANISESHLLLYVAVKTPPFFLLSKESCF